MNKAIYISGWDWDFSDREAYDSFIAMHRTDQETMQALGQGMELVYVQDRLDHAFRYDCGEYEWIPLKPQETGWPYPVCPEHKYLNMVADPQGLNRLGGEVPAEFQMPVCNSLMPFQYLGYVSGEDPYFSWLPFRLHLVFPLYLNLFHLWLDYSDPFHPVVLNLEEVERADSGFEGVNSESEVVFHALDYRFEDRAATGGFGHGGLPNWIQGLEIPVCPRSGRRLRFVCQIWDGVKTKRSNIELKYPYYQRYFEELNCWGDGCAMFFLEPETRIACFFIRNS